MRRQIPRRQNVKCSYMTTNNAEKSQIWILSDGILRTILMYLCRFFLKGPYP